MSGVAEAGLALGLISSIISIITAAKEIHETANNASGLPKAFNSVAAKLPLVVILLDEATRYLQRSDVDPKTCEAFKKILEPCEKSSNDLMGIFLKVVPKHGASKKWDRYWNAAKKLGKGGRVESLIGDILQGINLLSSFFTFPDSIQRELIRAREEMSTIEPSLPENFEVMALSMPNYQSPAIHMHLNMFQSSESVIRAWILPETLAAPDAVFDQTFHHEKLFRNPKNGYVTCDWILQTTEYSNFADLETSSILWIRGPPGSGKTVLCSSIVDRIQSENTGTKKVHILYCYGRRDPEPLNSMILVRVLLAQVLLWENSEVTHEIEKFYSKHKVLKEYDTQMEEEVWSLLCRVLALVTERVYIVVDGLDECAQPLITAIFLIALTAKLDVTPKFSLLLSSRFESRNVFQNKTVKRMLVKSSIKIIQLDITQERTSQDLAEFITYRVSSHPSFLSTSGKIKERFINGVLERANGMFLFASLIIEDLKRDKIASISAVDTTLAELPKGLPDIYSSNLELPKESLKGREVLIWLFCSNSSLTWHELKSGLAIVDSGFSEDEIVEDTCEEFIQHSCGPLVECFGDSMEYLRFIHPTVNEFLRESDGPGNEMGLQRGHSMLASKLLTFLDYEDLPDFSPLDEQLPHYIIERYTLQKGHGLYSYATFNWYKHLKKCDKSLDPELERKVLDFLKSPTALTRWLKSAIIMTDTARDGKDSTSLTADVVDSLQTWVQRRSWSNSQSPTLAQNWIKDFLDLMLDWGKVLENQPYWVHYIHHQLLPEGNHFRTLLEEDGDQSIIQFKVNKIISKSSKEVTWPDRCFAMDINRDLAFTYDEPFISCYHIRTGMFTAEILVPIPDNVIGPLVLRRGVICPQHKYLAVLFETMDALSDPIGAKIRSGQQLRLNIFSTTEKPLAWKLEQDGDFGETSILAEMMGIQRPKFVVCLLELQHEGPARTHLFGLPKWATSPILEIESQMTRWEIDDVDVLNFSSDSSKLSTAFGVYDLTSGEKENQWTFAIDPLLRGGKVTLDFKIFTAVHRIHTESMLVLYDMTAQKLKEFEFPGIVHILTLSNHGRFFLLLRVQASKEKSIKKVKGSNPQQGTIGIFDAEKKVWTPLLVLEPPTSKRQAPWNLAHYKFPPRMSSEVEAKKGANKVLIYAPTGWKVTNNVRYVNSIDPKHGHILLFEAERFANGFGNHPSLKFQLPVNTQGLAGFVTENLKTEILSWDNQFNTLYTFHKNTFQELKPTELKGSYITVDDIHAKSSEPITKALADPQRGICVLLVSLCRSAIFQIHVFPDIQHDVESSMSLVTGVEEVPTPFNNNFHVISITRLDINSSLPTFSTLKHYTSSDLQYSPLGLHYFHSTNSTEAGLGSVEFNVLGSDNSLTISAKETHGSTFEKALKHFKSVSNPLESKSTRSGLLKTDNLLSKPLYSIFDDESLSFQNIANSEVAEDERFEATGANTVQEDYYILQCSKPLRRSLADQKLREARQFEVYLSLFDKRLDKVSWILHTTTAGEIAGGKSAIPEISWAVHPNLPLLAWLLPGHTLRLSHFKCQEPPISIGESLTLEVNSTQAIKFSPDGRYIMVRGRDAIKNDLTNSHPVEGIISIMLCDLFEGRTTGLTISDNSGGSVDLLNHCLKIHRLTRDGGIEERVYSLPNLALLERSYLTFLPAHTCCTTCGLAFEAGCNIFILENEGSRLVIISHSVVNIGVAAMADEECDPLILRLTGPTIQIENFEDGLLVAWSLDLFPQVLNERNELSSGAFSTSSMACTRETTCQCCSCTREKKDSIIRGKSIKPFKVDQVKILISDYQYAKDQAVQPEDLESFLWGLESKATQALVRKDGGVTADKWYADMKRALGDDQFPFDSWDEFREAMDAIKEEFDFEQYIKGLYIPGQCGVGCQIPLLIHTFHFDEDVAINKVSLHWSSAMAVGWIEEDIEWFYQRFFDDKLQNARAWYGFRPYLEYDEKIKKLRFDKGPKGRRMRKYFGGAFTNTSTPDIDLLDLPSNEKGDEIDEKGLKSDSADNNGDEMHPSLFFGLPKDYMESVSDVIPGVRRFFELQLHRMMNDRGIRKLEDL